MSTICPNCLRPVRMEAKFCGYCGSSLSSASRDDGQAASTATQENESAKEFSYEPQPKISGGKVRRTILMVIIILLCLVLLVAFSVYYFQIIR